MSDIFKEQIIKKKKNSIELAMFFFIPLMSLGLAFVSLFFFNFFGAFIAAAILYGAYFLMGRFNIEYEYAYTNGELDIDVIYAKNIRKRKLTTDLKDVSVVCYADDNENKHYFNNCVKTYKFTSNSKEGYRNIHFVANVNGEQVEIVIEPNTKMLDAMKKTINPRIFKIN